MDLFVALTIPGMAHISLCFFDTCSSCLSNVATKGVDKVFCVSLEHPSHRGELHHVDCQ